jgi:hypothetical protein
MALLTPLERLGEQDYSPLERLWEDICLLEVFGGETFRCL